MPVLTASKSPEEGLLYPRRDQKPRLEGATNLRHGPAGRGGHGFLSGLDPRERAGARAECVGVDAPAVGVDRGEVGGLTDEAIEQPATPTGN